MEPNWQSYWNYISLLFRSLSIFVLMLAATTLWVWKRFWIFLPYPSKDRMWPWGSDPVTRYWRGVRPHLPRCLPDSPPDSLDPILSHLFLRQPCRRFLQFLLPPPLYLFDLKRLIHGQPLVGQWHIP